ncbi:MAG: DUF389 domain-containing protein [Cyanobacteria bacterium P01_A01_bin.83]
MSVLISSNPRYITYFKIFLRKIKARKIWNAESGEWHWLHEKPLPIKILNRNLWRLSVPTFTYHFMLGMSAIIATLGLLANSVAIIIGAMIVAPLMGPIVGMGYAIASGNRKLLRRSSLTLFKGVILTIAVSWIVASLIGLEAVNTEILARSNPTLIDFGIAMAAGAAGAFANTRRSIATAMPGVAIAVALVPPLSVVGIGLSLGDLVLARGSLLLFITNLVCIVFFGGLIFVFQSYGTLLKAKQGLIFAVITLALLSFPLSFSMRSLLVEKNLRFRVREIIIEKTETFSSSNIESVKVVHQLDFIEILIELYAPDESLSRQKIDRVAKLLAKELDEPIELQIRVIPVNNYRIKVSE